jgi:hypothetical protein
MKTDIEEAIATVRDWQYDDDIMVGDAAVVLSAEVVACHAVMAQLSASLTNLCAAAENYRDSDCSRQPTRELNAALAASRAIVPVARPLVE